MLLGKKEGAVCRMLGDHQESESGILLSPRLSWAHLTAKKTTNSCTSTKRMAQPAQLQDAGRPCCRWSTLLPASWTLGRPNLEGNTPSWAACCMYTVCLGTNSLAWLTTFQMEIAHSASRQDFTGTPGPGELQSGVFFISYFLKIQFTYNNCL